MHILKTKIWMLLASLMIIGVIMVQNALLDEVYINVKS